MLRFYTADFAEEVGVTGVFYVTITSGTLKAAENVTIEGGVAIYYPVNITINTSLPPINVVPIADAGGPYSAEVGETITFSGSGSSDSDGTITGYRWDWTNDGTWDTDWSSSTDATHSYPSDGTYTVKLQVKDNGSAIDNDTATVFVACEEPSNLTVVKSVKIDCNTPYHTDGYVIELNDPHWVTFKISVESDGSFDTVSIHDLLPVGLEFNSTWSSSHGWPLPNVVGDGTLYWNYTGIYDGWSKIIYFRADIVDGFCDNVTNIVEVTGVSSGMDDVVVTDSAWIDIICENQPELSVEKYVKWDCCGDFGDDITFDIHDFNWVTFKLWVNTSDAFDTIRVRDELPVGLSYVSGYATVNGSSWEPEVDGNILWWNFTGVATDESFEILFRADVDDCGDFENVVNVTGEFCGDVAWDEDNAWMHVTGCSQPELSVEKYVKWNCHLPFKKNVTADVGDWVTFKLYINNTGDIPLDIYVRDELPSGLTYITGSTDITGISVSPEEPEISGNTLYWNFTNVPYGVSIVITFRADVDECGEHVNLVNVTGKYDCQGRIYDEDTAIVWVPCPPGEEDLTVEKYVKWYCTPPFKKNVTADVGDWVTFKLYVNNTGDVPLDITVKDELPPGLSYVVGSTNIAGVSVSPEEPVISGNTLSWYLDDVPDGASIVITFRADVDECGEHINVVNVTGEYECQDIYDEDTAVVNVSTTGNHAPAASNPDPADDSTDVNPNDVTLSVTATDNDDDTMNVSFYNASDDSLIEKVTGVSNDSTASATWGDLAHNTTYTWYVVVDDSKTTVKSVMWSFKTEPVGMNHAPDAPYNPTPYNGANNVDRNPTLQVRVSDPDDDTLTVRFYDADDDTLIGTDYNVASGDTASVTWSGLSASTSYSWYAKASDSEYTTPSSTWSFTTESPDVNIDIEINGGIGVSAEIMNLGSDDAEDVSWSIQVTNKGLFNRINKSDNGLIDTIEGGDVVAKKLMFFRIARIEITATAECVECTAVTETADGIILGCFVILTGTR
jgi:uncharacterized repeat protein (TIGR01451 family)